MAIAASLILHVPILPLVGMWAPTPIDASRERNVTAVFDALMEEERIVPVDLESLGGGEPLAAAAASGPALGATRLTENPEARGTVSKALPDIMKTVDPGRFAMPSDPDGGASLPGLAERAPVDDAVQASTGTARGASSLTPEEERAMRAKWFPWYRSLIGRTLTSAYPKARLEKEGLRGSISFMIELAPDGSLKSFRILEASSDTMKAELKKSINAIERFPSYAATGLDFFPPFLFRIDHGPRGARASRMRRRAPALCSASSDL
jgi:hypothetical protein